MTRYFTEKITKEDLAQKIREAIKIREKKEISSENEDYYDYSNLTDKVSTDTLKVNFGTENSSIEDAYGDCDGSVLGYNTLENGLSYLGVNAGGDWEEPIFYMLYWDGKNIRGYVPKEGNTWNKKNKCAFGNDEEEDEMALKEMGLGYDENNPQESFSQVKYDFTKMFEEIERHIIYKGE